MYVAETGQLVTMLNAFSKKRSTGSSLHDEPLPLFGRRLGPCGRNRAGNR